jgi:hypothetical protein
MKTINIRRKIWTVSLGFGEGKDLLNQVMKPRSCKRIDVQIFVHKRLTFQNYKSIINISLLFSFQSEKRSENYKNWKGEDKFIIYLYMTEHLRKAY